MSLGVIFGSSDVVTQMTGNAMPIFLAGLLFYAFSRITTSGFYATEQSLFSYICVYAEPVTFIDPFVDCAADFETGRCVAEHGAFTDPDCRNRMFASSEREEADCVTA